VSLDGIEPLTAEQAIRLLVENLEHPVAVAFRHYVVSSYDQINQNPAYVEAVRLAIFLNRLPDFRSRVPLYRGLTFDSENLRREFMAQLEDGIFVNAHTVMSTSKRLGTAKSFARKGEFPLLFDIRNHFSGKDLEPIVRVIVPKFVRQREVAFARGARFSLIHSSQVEIGELTAPILSLREESESV
jgi:hypothetical protein